MKKPAAERHNKVVSTKHTPGQLRRLKELAAKSRMGVCSYASRVLHAHLEEFQPIGPITESGKAPEPHLVAPNSPGEVQPPSSDLLAAGKQLAAAIEASTLEYRMHACWYEWTAGLLEGGDRYLAFEAAWIAPDYKLAETLARDAKAEHRRP